MSAWGGFKLGKRRQGRWLEEQRKSSLSRLLGRHYLLGLASGREMTGVAKSFDCRLPGSLEVCFLVGSESCNMAEGLGDSLAQCGSSSG